MEEPRTPLMKPKKSRKASKRSVQDQIAEFMAFESANKEEFVAEFGTEMGIQGIQEESPRAGFQEDRIEEWLSSRGIIKGDPRAKKDDFFQKKKSCVVKITSQKKQSIDSDTQDQEGNFIHCGDCGNESPLSMRRRMMLSLTDAFDSPSSMQTYEGSLSFDQLESFQLRLVKRREKIPSHQKEINGFDF